MQNVLSALHIDFETGLVMIQIQVDSNLDSNQFELFGKYIRAQIVKFGF